MEAIAEIGEMAGATNLENNEHFCIHVKFEVPIIYSHKDVP